MEIAEYERGIDEAAALATSIVDFGVRGKFEKNSAIKDISLDKSKSPNADDYILYTQNGTFKEKMFTAGELGINNFIIDNIQRGRLEQLDINFENTHLLIHQRCNDMPGTSILTYLIPTTHTDETHRPVAPHQLVVRMLDNDLEKLLKLTAQNPNFNKQFFFQISKGLERTDTTKRNTEASKLAIINIDAIPKELFDPRDVLEKPITKIVREGLWRRKKEVRIGVDRIERMLTFNQILGKKGHNILKEILNLNSGVVTQYQYNR